jgi:hypothetical protein
MGRDAPEDLVELGGDLEEGLLAHERDCVRADLVRNAQALPQLCLANQVRGYVGLRMRSTPERGNMGIQQRNERGVQEAATNHH